ncbi:solute carrier family 13 member 2 [Plakobranchus ocellatus]|uniref:Solute carrier family 13 member 2 n=1 Tax=Plakobranchus ocellatus TaxID=259542 RepID=A0AAV4D0K6_9GAST|nr:solute carrier family 13 member 2 [Plakobranchus ocellatus]
MSSRGRYDLFEASPTSPDHRPASAMSAGFWTHLWAWRKFVILFTTPCLLAPLPAVVGSQDTNMLFVGGLLVAIAIEYWSLHKRIALRILLFVGSEPRWVMLGLMLATWFLSMWISNTATTAMMLPITEAILQQLGGSRSQSKKLGNEDSQEYAYVNNGYDGSTRHTGQASIELSVVPYPKDNEKLGSSDHNGDAVNEVDKHENEAEKPTTAGRGLSDAEFTRLCKGMSLCICYAASCGGIASLTGTGPNLILKENSDDLYRTSSLSNPVTFGTWMAFGLPMSVIILVIVWIWLQIAFLGRKGVLCCLKGDKQDPETGSKIKDLIKEEYRKLGPIVFGQSMVLMVFALLVILWITRDMGGEVGWKSLFDLDVNDSVPAALMGISLFVLPATIPCINSYSDYSHPEKLEQPHLAHKLTIRPLLNWHIVHQKMPWQIIFLLGGGFALSDGFDESGLSDWIGTKLEFFKDWDEWAVLIMICYIAAACTEVTSNTAMASVLIPIMQRLAVGIGAHPLLYMFPVCLSTSFAFMLPVATPPNAIVFTYGRVKVSDMTRAGIVLNVVSVPFVVIMTKTLGQVIFDFNDIPADFPLNSTQPVSI